MCERGKRGATIEVRLKRCADCRSDRRQQASDSIQRITQTRSHCEFQLLVMLATNRVSQIRIRYRGSQIFFV
jgi:hypothetical protein